MGFFGRLLGTFPYILCFFCSAIILGFYSYFLAVQSDRDRTIPNWQKAVEGISGVGVVYTILATVLTPCLGGVRILAVLGMILDVAFAGGFIAIAVLTRDGAKKCTGIVDTPLGRGNAETGEGFGDNGFGTSGGEQVTYQARYGTVCRYNKVCFAVSIIGAFLFLIAAICQFWFTRRAQKEKRYGPSPANNYTSGSGKKAPFWKRNRRGTVNNGDSELGAYGAGAPAASAVGGPNVDTRPSGETAYTGSTVGPNHTTYEPYKADAGYGAQTNGFTGTHGGIANTSNPYGYEKTNPHNF
ncbi:hypothetical protein SLS56_011612 [Neofusicoccum ribis]|uniref:MARVEL domain-containing protein n=1 Tax=Neofusicoccum ribis TaxID=45134 RepID=A0ABR3SBU0_9PEZI